MHFTHLDLGFGFLEFFGVFEDWWVFCKIFGLGVVFLMVYDHALHPICIFTMFHAFKCVFICCMLIGLDWVEPMMQIFFFLHVTCSCTFHAYVLFFFFGYSVVMVLFCFSLFLSLSRIVCAWHPSTNLLHLGTLYVLRHLLLTLLFFTYGSVIRRPNRTSWRTSLDVVFIRSTM